MEDSGRRPQQLEAVERPAEPGKGKGREERRDTASFVVAEVGDVLSIKAQYVSSTAPDFASKYNSVSLFVCFVFRFCLFVCFVFSFCLFVSLFLFCCLFVCCCFLYTVLP